MTFAGFVVFRGVRPEKPKDASTIGFSDSLWRFTQRCWDGDMKLRPKVGELVKHLGEAAVKWGKPMPPHVPVKDAASNPREAWSDSLQHGESDILILPLILPIEQPRSWNLSLGFNRCLGELRRVEIYLWDICLWGIQLVEFTTHLAHRIVSGRIPEGRF